MSRDILYLVIECTVRTSPFSMVVDSGEILHRGNGGVISTFVAIVSYNPIINKCMDGIS